jgi:hypothetical protein
LRRLRRHPSRDIDALNEEMVAAGGKKFVGGLSPAGSATSLRRQSDGKVLVTDGSYLETKEHEGGFWILKAADRDGVLAWWGRQAVIACRAPVEVCAFFPLEHRYRKKGDSNEESGYSSRLRYPHGRLWSGYGTRACSYAGGG